MQGQDSHYVEKKKKTFCNQWNVALEWVYTSMPSSALLH